MPNVAMTHSSDDRISALADGELSENEASAVFAKIGVDAGAVARWDSYHLIGDVLRGTGAAGIDRAAFAARLAAEPAIIAAPRRARAPIVAAPSLRSGRTWLSAAAGIAAAALVGWVALPNFWSGATGTLAQTAAAPMTPIKPAAMTASTTATAAPVRPAVVPIAHGVDDYLLAHQRYSSTSAMQGAVPYVRLVTEEAKEPRQ